MHHFRVFNTATLYEQNSLDIPPKADPADFYLDHKYQINPSHLHTNAHNQIRGCK